MKFVRGALVATSFILIPLTSNAADLIGRAQFKDADSGYIAGKEFRLSGIDAPEWGQVCTRGGKKWMAGQDAARAVKSLVIDKTLVCEDTGGRTYRRIVVKCYLEGRDLNDTIVRLGWAMDYPKYSGGAYSDAQNAAKARRAGIWQGGCMPPWEWRSTQKRKD